eukprot:TRINITY_DN49963_c0_g1_i1.p1 TRINITY_DN49963_c0_g1~~TRINITY_DN49963_c0_g1_i1.p1  ORF type:complete len:169 (-),score=36.66 TRINITY_DN49963_c0_g1_i1:70-546(-)
MSQTRAGGRSSKPSRALPRALPRKASSSSSLLASGQLQTASASDLTISIGGVEMPRYRFKTERSCSLQEHLAKMKKTKVDHSAHLKESPLQMRGPAHRGPWTSNTQDQQRGPAVKAQDPKWSTEIKQIDADIIGSIQLENTISVSLPMVPEMPHMRGR